MSEPARATPRRVTPLALCVWFAAAFVGTICGIGGGIFAVPLLHYGLRLPLRIAVGTSLVLVFAMTSVATIGESLHGRSALDWVVVGLLLFGSIPGAHFGYAFGKRTDGRTLKKLFVVVLVIAALRTATLDADTVVRHNDGTTVLDVLRCLWIVLIGFGGGFVAPLLGVGGGILVIPALFLSLPSMGYLDARACSMAMSVVNAAQSVWFHLRDDAIDRRTALPFTLIAIAAAVLGTFAVHLDGWAEIARICMTALLIVVALRFAGDVWSQRA